MSTPSRGRRGRRRRRKSPERNRNSSSSSPTHFLTPHSHPEKKVSTYIGEILRNSSVQVFWQSRAASYAGKVVEISHNANGERMYQLFYDVDQTTKFYNETELRKKIWQGVRMAYFMVRFVTVIKEAVASQKQVFGTTLRTVEDLFYALDLNGDGMVDAAELKNVFNQIGGMNFSNDEECMEFVSLLDSDNSKSLDLRELARVIKRQRKQGMRKGGRSVHAPMTSPEETAMMEVPHLVVRFIEGNLGIELGEEINNESTTVVSVEEGSQADYLSGGRSLVGARIVSISNQTCARDIYDEDDFIESITELERPVIVRFDGEQFRVTNVKSHQKTKVETSVEPTQQQQQQQQQQGRRQQQRPRTPVLDIPSAKKLVFQLLAVCSQMDVQKDTVKMAQQCIKKTQSYGEMCVIISHVIRGSKSSYLKQSAGRAKNPSISSKINIGELEIRNAKSAVDVNKVGLTPAHKVAINETFRWVTTYPQLFEVLCASLRLDPVRSFRRFTLRWKPHCKDTEARIDQELESGGHSHFDGSMKSEILACITSFPFGTECFKEHARYVVVSGRI